MRHTIYAAKNLVIDGRPVKKLDVLAVVETEHDVRKVVASLGNGAGALDGPKPEAAIAAVDGKPKK